MSKTIAFVCRVAVMLTFLIAIPLIALFGKSLPDVAETVWEYWKKPAPDNTWANSGEAPPFSPGNLPANPVDQASPQPIAATTPPIPSPTVEIPATPLPLAGSNGGNTVDPAAYLAPSPSNTTAVTAVPAPPYAFQPNLSATTPQDTPTTPLPPMQQPIQPPMQPPVQPQPQPTPQPSQVQIAEQIGKRLQELGAVNYHLELWGNDRSLSRFQCRMAVQGTPGLTQQFEWTHQDPIQAMQAVLYQVETWRGTNANASTVVP